MADTELRLSGPEANAIISTQQNIGQAQTQLMAMVKDVAESKGVVLPEHWGWETTQVPMGQGDDKRIVTMLIVKKEPPADVVPPAPVKTPVVEAPQA